MRQIERSITGFFLPTPESVAIPLAKRIESQRQFLNEYASQMDISRFLAENPIFKKELSKQGRFGIILLVISLIFIFLLIVLLKLY